MSPDLHGTILKRHCYTEDLQRLFASLSGDYNPLHVDSVAARRTLAGRRAVHGVHQVLTLLEAMLARFADQARSIPGIVGFKGQFLNPVAVGDTVELLLTKITDETCRIAISIEETVLCKATFLFGAATKASNPELPSLEVAPVIELSFEELGAKAGSLNLGLDATLARRLFPLAMELLGNVKIAEILALSRLVGMNCPGLHSLFAQANVHFDGTNAAGKLNYQVKQADERFSRVVMSVQGPTLQGELLTYFRPPPVAQASLATVKKVVEASAFAHSVALIVGGSRGLGEITAKIISAGGGLPIITFLQGREDAERLAGEIREMGGRCDILQLDVQNCEEILRKMGTGTSIPKSLYYFATPKIPGRQRGVFSHAMLHEFNEIYVTSFGRLIDAVAAMQPAKLRVFYPSSIMVTKGVKGMEEYAMAKRLGEEVCSFYNQNSRKVEIVVERLPRVRTDQTATLTPFSAQTSLDVMLPIVQRMEKCAVE